MKSLRGIAMWLLVVGIALFMVLIPVATYSQDLNSELYRAAEEGDISKVKVLLSQGAEVNTKNTYGWTALMLAAEDGHIETVKVLLAQGAEVNAKNTSGWTTALMFAAEDGHIETVKVLLAQGAEVNAKNKDGLTALMLAAQEGRIETVKVLLAQGAEVNAKNKDGLTALMWAVQKGHIETVKVLLAQGAEVNAKNKDGLTALMLAAKEGHTEIVEALLAQGAEVNVKDAYSLTALMYAEHEGHTEVISLLKQAAAVETSGQVSQQPAQREEVLDYTKEMKVENGLHLVLKVDCSRFSSGAQRDIVQGTAKIIANRLFLIWYNKKIPFGVYMVEPDEIIIQLPPIFKRKEVQIALDFTGQEAQDLTTALKTGVLPAPVRIVEERVISGVIGFDFQGTQGIIALVRFSASITAKNLKNKLDSQGIFGYIQMSGRGEKEYLVWLKTNPAQAEKVIKEIFKNIPGDLLRIETISARIKPDIVY